MAIFEDGLTVTARGADVLAGQRIRSPSLEEYPWFWVDDPIGSYLVYRDAVAGVVVADTYTGQRYALPVVEESLTLDTLTTLWQQLKVTAADQVAARIAVRTALGSALVDAIEAADVLIVARGQMLVDVVRAPDGASGQRRRSVVVDELVPLQGEVQWLWGAQVADTVATGELWTYVPVRPVVLVEALVAGSVVSPQLRAVAVVPEFFTMTAITSWQWIFASLLEEQVTVRGGIDIPLTDPITGTTWSVNARTGGVTEYRNFAFNSFAPSGNKYLGASDEGLFELNGDTDDGADIIAQVRSGFFQLGGSRFSSVKTAYLGMNAEGTIYLRMLLGDGRATTYRVTAKPMQTTKVPMGKGLRARYFAFEFETVGQDFDLDAVEFVPLVMERRV